MPEVAVSKKTSETPATTGPSTIFRPMWPFGRLSSLSPFAMSPLALMREVADEMGLALRGNGGATSLEAWAPAVDIQRCNGSLIISAELPGLKKEDVKIEVTDEALVIEGERKQEHKEDHEGYHRWERSYGGFYRSIPLPEGAKTDQIKAELKDGILKVSIPVPESAKKSRQVTITA